MVPLLQGRPFTAPADDSSRDQPGDLAHVNGVAIGSHEDNLAGFIRSRRLRIADVEKFSRSVFHRLNRPGHRGALDVDIED